MLCDVNSNITLSKGARRCSVYSSRRFRASRAKVPRDARPSRSRKLLADAGGSLRELFASHLQSTRLAPASRRRGASRSRSSRTRPHFVLCPFYGEIMERGSEHLSRRDAALVGRCVKVTADAAGRSSRPDRPASQRRRM